MSRRLCLFLAACTGIAIGLFANVRTAAACGCLSPPAPTLDTDEYAVNQQAEQIIFEVEEDHVVAHVLIRYAGSPESFAWIVPVPAVPELSLSSTAAFGLLDEATRPDVKVRLRDYCPVGEYRCTYPGAPDNCIWPQENFVDSGASGSDAAAPPPGSPGPVEIIDRQTIGAYDTVILAAGDAQAAVDWLQNEGFIVNSTMAPYMQPYADEGMYFVASRLVPGADVTEIRPLSMRYLGTEPMIPLRLTAVAAEPNMTITAYIYGDTLFAPSGRSLVELSDELISRDPSGRDNYPMVLARVIDQTGGDSFVAEYMGAPALPDFDQGSGCCNTEWDFCGIAFDGVCSCPGDPYDDVDCMEQTELLEGVALLDDLAQRYTRLTRLTTRMSAEDMTFDPIFSALPPDEPGFGRLSLQGESARLIGCEDDIIEAERYEDIMARQACASMYCGAGECVTTDVGPACVCPEGTVARKFTDLDGEESVTCVPDQHPVDYGADGQLLPDACAGILCGQGTCVDVGGFPTCRCDPGAAAALTDYPRIAPCRAIEQATGTPGAQDYSQEVPEVRVCAPAPPSDCGELGWLVESAPGGIRGEACMSSEPDPALLSPPRPATCEDFGAITPKTGGGCGCRADGLADTPGGLAGWIVLLGVVLLGLRRMRVARAR